MADTITYEFDAWAEGVEEWSTNPGEMVDGVETDYASTTTDGDIQKLTGNECDGTDLGAISKVEIRAYAYSDADDQLILRPVFGGADDGDNHTEAPGVTAGWKTWWDITGDTNAPTREGYQTGDDAYIAAFGVRAVAQTFSHVATFSITKISLKLYRVGSPGTVTVSIRATSGGAPTGGDLTSGTLNGNDFTTDAGGVWYTFDLTPYSLTGGVTYAIVLSASAGSSGQDVRWRFDTTSGTYANGVLYLTLDGSNWDPTGDGDDAMFAIPFWSWSDVQNLDCDVEENDVSKGNTMHCGMVQIQVTYTAGGPPAITGTADLTTQPAAIAATGVYTPQAITGDSAVATQPAQAAATASQTFAAASAVASQSAEVAAEAALTFAATSVMTSQPAQVAAIGVYTPLTITGTADLVAQPAQISAEGTVSVPGITGIADLTAQLATIAASASLAFAGTGDLTTEAASAIATGAQTFAGQAEISAQPAEVAATGALVFTGASVLEAQPAQVAAEATYTPQAITGTADVVAHPATIATEGEVEIEGFTGTAALTAQPAQVAASGTLTFVGQTALETEPATAAATGKLTFVSTADMTGEPAEIAATGAQTFAGIGSIETESTEVSAVGKLAFSGQAALVAQPAQVVAIGTYTALAITGIASIVVEPAVIAAQGKLVFLGSGAVEAQCAVLTGQVVLVFAGQSDMVGEVVALHAIGAVSLPPPGIARAVLEHWPDIIAELEHRPDVVAHLEHWLDIVVVELVHLPNVVAETEHRVDVIVEMETD